MHESDEQRDQKLEELSALSTHLLSQVEAERAALAKELHDELGGLITAAKMDLSWLSSRVGGSLDAECNDKLNSVMLMLNQAMVLKRRVVENLRPSLLDHFGLAVALRSHFEDHCRRAGIECVATLADETLALDPVVQLTLFRVAQEALVGIIGRGGAKNVEVVIEPDAQGYVMVVGDDGAPMNTDLVYSMPSVRHRIFAAGGTVEAEVRPAHGNRIRVFVPRSAAISA